MSEATKDVLKQLSPKALVKALRSSGYVFGDRDGDSSDFDSDSRIETK